VDGFDAAEYPIRQFGDSEISPAVLSRFTYLPDINDDAKLVVVDAPNLAAP